MPKLLAFWLQSKWSEGFFAQICNRWIGQAGINQSKLLALELPIPPLEQQAHVCDALGLQIAEVDKARAATEAQLEAANRLPSVYLSSVFEPENTEGWEQKHLGDICLDNGTYGTSAKASETPNGLPVLRMGNIENGKVSWDSLKYLSLSEDEEKKYLLTEGDILFNRTNSAELVGKSAVFSGSQAAIFASYIIRFRIASEVANPRFVCYFINSRQGRGFIEANMARAIGQVNISASTMRKMEIPLPPLSAQKHFVSMLETQMTEVEKLSEKLRAQLETINALPASLLREAFTGELTRQPSPEDLRAALTCLAVERLHYRPFFGVVMLMKVLYFAQVQLGIPLGYTIRRYKHGPFDKAVYDLEKAGERQGWFSVDESGHKQGSKYVPGTELDDLARKAEGTLGRWQGELNGLLDLAETFDTTALEALATLHAAWNDLLLEGRQPKDSEIIAEVLEGWPGKVDEFTKGELRQYLAYLKKSPYVPKGTGQNTKPIFNQTTVALIT